MAVERSAAAILHWSWWRGWHQAWARYYHYRRRHSAASGCDPSAAAAEQAAAPQMDVMEVVWSRLEPLLPPAKRVGHPYGHSRRLVLEAIVYVMQTDCGWAALPSRFPPWKTVYSQYSQWRKIGVWEIIWAGLDKSRSVKQLQL